MNGYNGRGGAWITWGVRLAARLSAAMRRATACDPAYGADVVRGTRRHVRYDGRDSQGLGSREGYALPAIFTQRLSVPGASRRATRHLQEQTLEILREPGTAALEKLDAFLDRLVAFPRRTWICSTAATNRCAVPTVWSAFRIPRTTGAARPSSGSCGQLSVRET